MVFNILIYGIHSIDWNTTLTNNDLWSKILPNNQCVINQIRREGANNLLIRLKKTHYDLILPLLENDIKEVSSAAQVIYTSNTIIQSVDSLININKLFRLIPTIDMVNNFADKKLFYYYMKNNNFIEWIPYTYDFFQKDIQYPCIFKPTNYNNGNHMHIFHNENDLVNHLKSWKNDYIIQVFYPGKKEYTSTLICSNGTIIDHITYMYSINREYYCNSNKLLFRKIEKVIILPSVLDIFSIILKKCLFNGPCNIDYKINNDTGYPVIFEINPRFGGSLMRPENKTDLIKIVSSIINHINMPLV